ncbi:MAG: hypothetical protein KGQ40_09685 [Rhodospirillales bacterium]|nr:hypothetical protein [Rhodospirillales bacterium]
MVTRGVLQWAMRPLILLLPVLLAACAGGPGRAAPPEQAGTQGAAADPGALPPPAFCTRSLGVVDCWANPAALNGQPVREVADGPRRLTPAQQRDARRGWLPF